VEGGLQVMMAHVKHVACRWVTYRLDVKVGK